MVKRHSIVRTAASAAAAGALLAFMLLVAAGVVGWRPGVGHAKASPAMMAKTPALPTSNESRSSGDQAAGGDGTRTDFEGDEVSPALATYGIDGEGNLFEVHSPHTEVPRLAAPTT